MGSGALYVLKEPESDLSTSSDDDILDQPSVSESFASCNGISIR